MPSPRARDEGRVRWGFVVLGIPVALVVAVVLLGALVGLRGGAGVGDDDRVPEDRVDVPAVEAPAADDTPTFSLGPVDSRALGPVVRVHGEDDAVGGLATDTVLRVEVDGFASNAVARAMQCAGGSCGNLVRVQFDADGTASFQYLVTDDFVPAADGRCRLDGTTCTLVVENTDGDDRAAIVTLFTDALPAPGRVAIQPATGLAARQLVSVGLEGFVAGATIELVVCALPATSGAARCSVEPSSITVDGAGGGRTSFRLPATVGRDRIACEASKCTVGVRSSTAFVRAAPARLFMAPPVPVDYDRRRLPAGLVVAGVLLALAAYFVSRTDWSPVGEEAAPEIDDAEYADLDALVAAMPPEEDLGEIVESRR